MQTPDTTIIAKKLHNRLKISSWDKLMKGFTLSDDFEKIIRTLENNVSDGMRFTPPLKQVFSAFERCPADDLKVVILNDEPHNILGIADGMAFSCGNTMKAVHSLELVLAEVNRTVYNDEQRSTDPDLSRWAQQGVLLLNTSLTAELNKMGRHSALWKPFVAYLIDMLNNNYPNLVWILVGRNMDYEDMINPEHTVLYTPSTFTGAERWDSNDAFVHANMYLEQDKKSAVVW